MWSIQNVILKYTQSAVGDVYIVWLRFGCTRGGWEVFYASHFRRIMEVLHKLTAHPDSFSKWLSAAGVSLGVIHLSFQ